MKARKKIFKASFLLSSPLPYFFLFLSYQISFFKGRAKDEREKERKKKKYGHIEKHLMCGVQILFP